MDSFFTDGNGESLPSRTPRPRKERAQRFAWRAKSNPQPYLWSNPQREIAVERQGAAYCPACREGYTARLVERIMSPAFLRAQRWAHAHNAEHHPRRWLRSQHFQAPIPAEIRERVAS